MKKLYTIAAAAIVVFSASAERQVLTVPVRLTHNISAESVEVKTVHEGISNVVRKAPAKAAASIADIEAVEIWSYYGLLTGQNGEQEAPVEITIDANTGEATVILVNTYTLKATFDAAAGTLSIPNKQYLGTDADGAYYFYVKSVDVEGNLLSGASSAEATVGTYSNGSIVFPETDVWASGDYNRENLGYYFLSAYNEFGSDPYVSLGNGQFIENIIYPTLMQGVENKTVSTVEVMTDGMGSYKVVDPFKALYADNNINAQSPDLIIDAKDPDNVLIELQSSGLGNQTVGAYAYFSESWYYDNYGKEEGEVFDPALTITKKVEGDNVTITIPYHAVTIMTTTSGEFLYGSLFESTLTFKDASSGISSVVTEDSDAPVKFFNLQGVEISNPAKGSVVIRVQGKNATKTIIR